MTKSTAGLSLAESFRQAQEELALSEESPETDISGPEPIEPLQVEQPVVETTQEVGLFDDQDGGEDENEQLQYAEDSMIVDLGDGVTKTVAELKSEGMMQADYTRKTQAIAEREREAEKALTLVQMLKERPTDTLRQLYTRINAGQDLDFTGEESPSNVQPTQGPEDIEALVEARVNEVLAHDPRLVALQQERALAKIESIFDGIESDYSVKLSDTDKQKVLERAQETGNTDLESVFGAMYAKRLAAEQRKTMDRQNMRDVKPIVGEGRQDSFNPQTPSTPKKYDSFRSALEEQLALEQETL